MVIYTNEQLDNDINTVVEITNRLKNIVWCEQTLEFNFARMLENSLKMYKNWFRKNGYGN